MRRCIGLLALMAVVLSLAGPALAASVTGTVSAVEDEGAFVVVKDKDGKEVKVRISSSGTDLTKGGKPIGRREVKVGDTVKVEYNDQDARKTASKFEVQ